MCFNLENINYKNKPQPNQSGKNRNPNYSGKWAEAQHKSQVNTMRNNRNLIDEKQSSFTKINENRKKYKYKIVNKFNKINQHIFEIYLKHNISINIKEIFTTLYAILATIALVATLLIILVGLFFLIKWFNNYFQYGYIITLGCLLAIWLTGIKLFYQEINICFYLLITVVNIYVIYVIAIC